MYFIEADNIVKQYANHRALDGVSLRVPEGKIFGLLGPNGAGKTTLIRIINRITAPDSGSIRFDGHPSQPDDVRRIGYLPEERGLYKKMKVGEQALYFARLKGMSAAEARASLTEWFERFDIMAWWNRRLEELSKGMQQKVQFIITVVHRPALLIFDEPFSGFDPVNAEHNMASVEEVCDEIALIDHSRVVLSGNVHEVRERYKEHLFEVEYVGAITLQPNPTRYTLISATPSGGGTAIRIRKSPTVSNAELLSSLSAQGELRAFREVLPSMNEIFIKTVEGRG